MLLHSFDVTAMDIHDVDLETLYALSVGVRWPHRPDDWRMFLASGEGVAALDEIGRLVGCAMWFPYTDDFATVGMVITTPRMQTNGLGRWLMDAVLQGTGERTIALNATRAAYRLYRSLGFERERTVFQCQGEAAPPPMVTLPPGTTSRAVEAADLDALVALDAAAFGASRADLLARLLLLGTGTVLVRDARIVAFALCRPFGRGHLVGPLVAADDADAIAVAQPEIAALAGRFLRLDCREARGDFPAFVQAAGLAVFDTVTSMTLRRRVRARTAGDGPPRVYALASHALS